MKVLRTAKTAQRFFKQTEDQGCRHLRDLTKGYKSKCSENILFYMGYFQPIQ